MSNRCDKPSRSDWFPKRTSSSAAVSVAGIALMIAAANLLAWESRLDRPWPKLF
jgi:hypothetical protein